MYTIISSTTTIKSYIIDHRLAASFPSNMYFSVSSNILCLMQEIFHTKMLIRSKRASTVKVRSLRVLFSILLISTIICKYGNCMKTRLRKIFGTRNVMMILLRSFGKPSFRSNNLKV